MCLCVFYRQGHAVATCIHPMSVDSRVRSESLHRGSDVSEKRVATQSEYQWAVFSTVLHILPVAPIST